MSHGEYADDTDRQTERRSEISATVFTGPMLLPSPSPADCVKALTETRTTTRDNHLVSSCAMHRLLTEGTLLPLRRHSDASSCPIPAPGRHIRNIRADPAVSR